MSSTNTRLNIIVDQVTAINALVTRFRFVPEDQGLLPPFSAGAHIVVEMPDKKDNEDIIRRNAYSLMSNPEERRYYEISVRRDDTGRGGSLFMHQKVHQGMKLNILAPSNLFPISWRGQKHLMIAGGIGITPFIAYIHHLSTFNAPFELHYSFRNTALASYAKELQQKHPHQIKPYCDDKGEKINLEALLAGQPLGTHLYVCGPKGMIDWVLNSAKQSGWADEQVHYEEFLAPPAGEPFKVQLSQSNRTIDVGRHESLLEALESAGIDPPFLCRGGVCGQCETKVVQADGTLIHNDHWLSEEQKQSGQYIMPCVSRFAGKGFIIER